MDPSFKEVLLENGVAVFMLVWFIRQNGILVKKLFRLIENNTQAGIDDIKKNTIKSIEDMKRIEY